MVSGALAAVNLDQQAKGHVLVEVCSVSGSKWVSIHDGQFDQSLHVSNHHSKHCVFCGAMPSTILNSAPLFFIQEGSNVSVENFYQLLTGVNDDFRSPLSRAPPQIS